MQAFILVLLSLVLFFLDSRSHYFDAVRPKISFVVNSVQRGFYWPIKLVDTTKESFASRKTILEENSRLQSELLLAKAKLQRLDFLEYENEQLQGLLGASREVKNKTLTARLLKTAIDSSSRLITVDKGEQDGVYVGQPALDAYGLLGQVISLKPKESKILLITNSKSAIPVVVTRNGFQTIVVGTGDRNYLELANVPETADIKAGDALVTSVLGRNFPAGYPVGIVREVKRVIGARFMKVIVMPKAHLNRSIHVLLVWPKSVDEKETINTH